MESDKLHILDHQELPEQTDPAYEVASDTQECVNEVSQSRLAGSCPRPSAAKNYTTSSSSYLSTSSSSRHPSPPSIESSNTDSLTEQGEIEFGYTVHPSTTSLQDPNINDQSFSPPPPRHFPSYDVSADQSVPDGPDLTVYKVTTESVEKDNTCCLTCYCRGCCMRLVSQGMTKRKIMIVLMLGIVTFTSSFALCLFPPFFPKLAESKGANAAVYGPIIGTNCLVSFIASPIIGQRLHVIGVRFAFLAGVFCSGGCCVLSGFLEHFPPGVEFVVAAVSIRIVHAIANAGIIMATFTFYAIEFPESRAKMFACYRSTMNIAQLIGPVVGGALLELGGFKLPFFIMGTLQMLMYFLSVRLLPYFQSRCDNKKEANKVSILSILSIPGIWVAFITYIFSTMSNGFLSVTLEPHVLRQFHMTPFYVGLLFGLKDGANSLAAPFWGWLCDRNCHIKGFIILATVFAFTSFVLLGPTPGLEIKQTLTMVSVALILNGIGICGQQLVGMDDAMREALDSGLPNSENTHGCVTGLCSSLAGAGRFVSRAASGILVTHIGFQNTSVIVLGLHLFVAFFTLCYITITSIMGSLSSSSSQPKCKVSKKGDCDPKAVVITKVKPGDLAYQKAVNLHIPIMGEDLEGSMILGSAPISYERYRRPSRNAHSSSLPRDSSICR